MGNPAALLLEGLLSLLFPPRCEVCGTLQEGVICASCAADFVPVTAPFCRQCGLPFDPLAQMLPECAACRTEPPVYDAARAAGVYGGKLRRAIHLLKYDGVRALAAPLGEFIARQVESPFPVDILCPVPLHPSRLALRGFNQSLLLAEVIGNRWDMAVQAEQLQRTQNTTPQMELPAAERERNVRGAFAVDGDVRGRSIALVDDVYTTGCTLRECARVLKRAGAARVLALTVARAV